MDSNSDEDAKETSSLLILQNNQQSSSEVESSGSEEEATWPLSTSNRLPSYERQSNTASVTPRKPFVRPRGSALDHRMRLYESLQKVAINSGDVDFTLEPPPHVLPPELFLHSILPWQEASTSSSEECVIWGK